MCACVYYPVHKTLRSLCIHTDQQNSIITILAAVRTYYRVEQQTNQLLAIRICISSGNSNNGPAVRSCSWLCIRMYIMAPLYIISVYAHVYVYVYAHTVR